MPSADRESLLSRRMELILQAPQEESGFVRHSCIVRRIDGTTSVDRILWYEVPSQVPRISPDDGEPYLLAAIMDAMGEGRSLHVGGRASFRLLSNLQEFMAAWSRWAPATFQVVQVTADSITTTGTPSDLPHDTAVTTHTGGIDAASTLMRHTRSLEGHGSRRIVAAVVVHGFLIDLDQTEKYARSFDLAKEMLDSVGIPTYPVRTNMAAVVGTHWSHLYGTIVVSVMQFFKTLAPCYLANAPKPYDDLIFPRGSNPISDPLLSSDSMQVVHDGARFDRLAKFDMVDRWPEAFRNLRVCWSGRQVEPNCGTCEECVRSKLSFMALGKPFPESLGATPTARQILSMEILNEAGLADFRGILEHCRRTGRNAPWVRALRWRITLAPAYRVSKHLKWILTRLRDRIRGWIPSAPAS